MQRKNSLSSGLKSVAFLAILEMLMKISVSLSSFPVLSSDISSQRADSSCTALLSLPADLHLSLLKRKRDTIDLPHLPLLLALCCQPQCPFIIADETQTLQNSLLLFPLSGVK